MVDFSFVLNFCILHITLRRNNHIFFHNCILNLRCYQQHGISINVIQLLNISKTVKWVSAVANFLHQFLFTNHCKKLMTTQARYVAKFTKEICNTTHHVVFSFKFSVHSFFLVLWELRLDWIALSTIWIKYFALFSSLFS